VTGGESAPGVAYYVERQDPSGRPAGLLPVSARAERAAQAEALRLVLREIPAAFGTEEWAQFQAREIVSLVASELGVEL
jgi:hypothetical protein